MNKLNELKANIDTMHNLAAEYDEIPTDGVLMPIGQTPPKREIDYYANEALTLIKEWHNEVENTEIVDTLNSIESNLNEIIN